MVIKMQKIYLILCVSALILGAYFYGVNIEKANCNIRYLNQERQIYEINIKKQKEFHDKVYKTGVADIRSILRDKYTIAE